MGGGGGPMGKAPTVPKPPSPPAAPVKEESQAEADKRMRAILAAKGRQSTILTSPETLGGPPKLSKPAALGV